MEGEAFRLKKNLILVVIMCKFNALRIVIIIMDDVL